jgi:hypothetical protein
MYTFTMITVIILMIVTTMASIKYGSKKQFKF